MSESQPQKQVPTNWDERYQAGKEALPWDIGVEAPELVAVFKSLKTTPQHTLEIGCGTGTNSIWMAQQGCRVVAVDISPTAIANAKEKMKAANVDVDFRTWNIIEKSPVAEASVDFVFDRGVYHVMEAEQRTVFIDRVAAALSDNGYWLCLAGCADEHRDANEEGPPQLKASDLIDYAQEQFEVHNLARTYFVLPNGKRCLAWEALFRKRKV